VEVRDRWSNARRDQVLIGIPGRDVSGKANAGAFVTYGASGVTGPTTRTGGAIAGLGYGTVVASER
jgi:hypothetical protein